MKIAHRRVEKFRRAGLSAARWFVNSQCLTRKPYWDANHGRFIYTRYLPDGRTVLGLNWTQARGIFVLLAGWELTREAAFLKSALLAGEYIKALQIYDSPDEPHRQYAIREQIPQSSYAAPRDATEACLGLLFLYRATGREDYLRRAVDYERWFKANAWGPSGWPVGRVHLDRRKRDVTIGSYQAGDGPMFYYLHKATGRRAYLDGLVRLGRQTVRRFLRADGAIVSRRLDAHHTDKAGVVLNDDGMMVSLLCASLATGDQRYLRACLRHGRWILDNVKSPLKILSALPCMCTFLIELSAVTGDESYRDWSASMLEKHVLPLQVRNRADPMSNGAFRGEDEPVKYYGPSRARKTDFITTRVTCYSALACLKLAGIVGPYYGALGWERKVRKLKRLPSLAME